MNQERLNKLFAFLEEEPNDPFLIYAIANEYLESKPTEAKKYYDRLLFEHENYTGTYYHAAQLYLDLGDKEKAESIYKKGLLICQKENDRHALAELQRAYNEFLYEDEEEDEW
ncbi:enzyme of heme biosynthesis [Sediminitomix flava]|uniref:Tetratricopeptide repeat protein n=1 Tax=Sediminitomix flava TaxID=379075 RepID=A0A315Z6N2_SEDFL|nr:enzyme of heme biosynthesis [Sediminitomix flava]PWJ38630.1 tetratricopeptide repeat protein [Sediminitomix flava]